jgi:LysM repeat protein
MKTNWETGIDMSPCTRHTTVIALIICMALPAWGQQYLLYTPQPVNSGQKTPSQDGILVKIIVVQKGDTLSGLSRKFSGRGMYFPQILLFNSIKNPDLIYAGNTLKIPVSQKEARDSDLSDLKTVGMGKNRASRHKRKTIVHAKENQPHESPAGTSPTSPRPAANKSAAAAPPAADSTGQNLFEAAVKAYRQDDCRTALELLDRYLADNSGSPLAADANLYKAECYLKLSAQ